jgi:tRNA (guanine-N7-)-methyltransferase
MGEAGFDRLAEAGVLTAQREAAPQRLLYGRRRGRALRPGQRHLKSELLPRLAVAIPAARALEPAALFDPTPQAVWLEIGFGGGEHLAEQAERHPRIGFVGSEVFENGIAKLLAEIDGRGLRNIRIFADDARLLLAALAPASVGRVLILFPDPWPKRRHHKRRIVARDVLDRLAVIMAEGAELRLATDDPDYLAWMLEHLTSHPAFVWLARRADDWRRRPSDQSPTRYEEKARAAGRPPVFLRFARKPR